MSDEDKAVEPEQLADDATVVHDELAEEKGHEELVSKVAKMLDDTPDDTSETPGKPEDTPEGETASDGEEVQLSEEVQARIKQSGLPEELAQQLHDAGQLDQVIAAFDRKAIDFIQSQKDKEAKKSAEKESKAEDEPSFDETELDPDVYDEAIVARDKAQTKRIEALEKMVEELVGSSSDGFDEWFDGALEELGVNTSDHDKCQDVFAAYGNVCEWFGVEPDARNKDMVRRALEARYPQVKAKKTVERLRDSDGKFVSSPASRGGPPPSNATPEEAHNHLVSKVASYLKEKGVEMTGY